MSAFTLDTSGEVFNSPRGTWPYRKFWPNLDPFTQRAISEASRELYERLIREGWTPEAANAAVAFRNWSPSALERIVRDCGGAEWGGRRDGWCGATFWQSRQDGNQGPRFLPLTVSLDDAGKVTLADRVRV